MRPTRPTAIDALLRPAFGFLCLPVAAAKGLEATPELLISPGFRTETIPNDLLAGANRGSDKAQRDDSIRILGDL